MKLGIFGIQVSVNVKPLVALNKEFTPSQIQICVIFVLLAAKTVWINRSVSNVLHLSRSITRHIHAKYNATVAHTSILRVLLARTAALVAWIVRIIWPANNVNQNILEFLKTWQCSNQWCRIKKSIPANLVKKIANIVTLIWVIQWWCLWIWLQTLAKIWRWTHLLIVL